jgi:hypothetical protein
VTAYLYEPEADDIGARLGNLYVVVEVLVSGRASEEVVDLIIETAGDKYYNEPGGELDPLARFEAAVKHTNHALSEYVGRGNAAWIGKLSAIVAVQTGHELHLTQTGSAEAFLYRGKAVSRISLTETNRPATPSKTFGSIATGELEAGDKLLVATPALVHQIPLAKLQSVISNGSPNAAISEISQLLEGAVTNRIAALVVEITTPELAALKVRSDEPEEIQLASNDTLAEAAFRAATPLAHTTVNTSKKVAGAAHSSWRQFKPKLRAASLAVVESIRRGLSTRNGRRIAAITALILLLIVIVTIWLSSAHASDAKKFSQYQTLFARFSAARETAASGDKIMARANFTSITTQLNKLGSSEAGINQQLKNNPLLQGEPTSVNSFKQLVAEQLDLLDGLVKVTPMTVAEIGVKNGRPTHFESDGNHAYVIDAGNHNVISIINLLDGVQKDSKADTSNLNDVVNTTLSASNDGMFILTSKPSVWFYRFSTDSLSELSIAYGAWPKASALASYGSNLYLLGDTSIYKHVRNATGYSPKSDYISTTTLDGKTTGLAVDGLIYVLSDTSLNRYLASTLKQSVPTPTALKHITNLRSTAGGEVLIGTSQTSNRIAVWTSKNDQLTFDKQISLRDGKTLYDATYDQKLGKVFATIDNRFVSFALKP